MSDSSRLDGTVALSTSEAEEVASLLRAASRSLRFEAGDMHPHPGPPGTIERLRTHATRCREISETLSLRLTTPDLRHGHS